MGGCLGCEIETLGAFSAQSHGTLLLRLPNQGKSKCRFLIVGHCSLCMIVKHQENLGGFVLVLTNLGCGTKPMVSSLILYG